MNLSVKEKIYGAIFGYAIGDALGIGTEFMSIHEVEKYYPDGLSDYSQIVRDAHRSLRKKGEWTNDTEIVLIVLESVTRLGYFNYLDIAQKMKEWYETNPTDLTINLRMVLSQPDFEIKPFESTKAVWDKAGTFENTSECIGRVIFSFLSYYPLETAADLCRLTHPKGRSIATCKVVAAMAEKLFKEDEPANFEELVRIARDGNADVVRYVETAYYGVLEDFHLDDEETWWFVRKSMGAALWSVWHCNSFEEGLDLVVNQGGDADTNAAAAAALLGIKYGYSSIPKHLIEGLIGKEKLYEIADKVVDLVEKNQNS